MKNVYETPDISVVSLESETDLMAAGISHYLPDPYPEEQDSPINDNPFGLGME